MRWRFLGRALGSGSIKLIGTKQMTFIPGRKEVNDNLLNLSVVCMYLNKCKEILLVIISTVIVFKVTL